MSCHGSKLGTNLLSVTVSLVGYPRKHVGTVGKVYVNRRNIGVWCRLVEDDPSSNHIVGGKGREDFFAFDIDIHPSLDQLSFNIPKTRVLCRRKIGSSLIWCESKLEY